MTAPRYHWMTPREFAERLYPREKLEAIHGEIEAEEKAIRDEMESAVLSLGPDATARQKYDAALKCTYRPGKPLSDAWLRWAMSEAAKLSMGEP